MGYSPWVAKSWTRLSDYHTHNHNCSVVLQISRTYSFYMTETSYLLNSRLIGKDPDAGKDRRQKKNGTTEGQIVGWHHRLNRHEFEQAPGDAEGQGSLASCSPWGHKESSMTEQLNNRIFKELKEKD